MTRDKQLVHLNFDQVAEKRRLDQALNTKEFAVLAGISYSTALAWFREPGFPSFRGFVFWQDFVQWRNAKNQLHADNEIPARQPEYRRPVETSQSRQYSPRVAKILAEAGVG